MGITTRRNGTIAIDNAALDVALGLRGISAQALAQRAGLTPETLSRARNGHRVFPATLRALADALLSFPVVEGAELLLAGPAAKAPDGNGHDGAHAPVAPVRRRLAPPDPNEGIVPEFIGDLRVIDLSDSRKPTGTARLAVIRQRKQIAATNDSVAATKESGHDRGPAPA
jgi:transcriptional regulator with XRE-family HTH domain